MSYILDALRRAQAERERGQVPGLHAQPGLAGAHRMRSPVGAAPAARPAWFWALAGAGLLALLMVPLAWWAMRGPALPLAAVKPVVQPAASTAQPLPSSPAAAGTAATAPAPAPQPPPLVVVSAAPAPPAPNKPVSKPAAPGAAKPAFSAAAAAAPEPALPAPPRPAATPTPAVAALPFTLPPALTPDQRREWPALTVGGSVWSDTPSARFVILGGQVVREGESTADGVLVERIAAKAVVLRWRDQRASLGL